MDGFFLKLGFPKFLNAQAITELFGTKKRCGLYVLNFKDGSYYIGQASDARRRFSQHRNNYPDIVRFSFKSVRQSLLDESERELIHLAEAKGIKLRNTIHVASLIGDSDLDDVVTPNEQTLWQETGAQPTRLLSGSSRLPFSASHVSRSTSKLERFDRQPMAPATTNALRHYLQATILSPMQTELKFWSLSCMPSTNAGSWPRLACMNINWMEVFVIGVEHGSAEHIWAFVNVSKSALKPDYPTAAKFRRKHPRAEIMDTRKYRAAGFDQVHVHCEDLQTLGALLADSVINRAARQLNLRLMRRGPAMYARYHCPGLADRIL